MITKGDLAAISTILNNHVESRHFVVLHGTQE